VISITYRRELHIFIRLLRAILGVERRYIYYHVRYHRGALQRAQRRVGRAPKLSLYLLGRVVQPPLFYSASLVREEAGGGRGKIKRLAHPGKWCSGWSWPLIPTRFPARVEALGALEGPLTVV
jgi:hypothetical protein